MEGREGRQVSTLGQSSAAYSETERAALWKRRWLHARTFYDPLNQKYEKELEFSLKLRHWASETAEPTPQDKNDRFKGRELYSKLRRIVAEVTASKFTPTTIPIDSETDPKAADAAKFPVEHVTKTTDYGFAVYFERAIWGAAAARRGWMVAEWDARINDLTFRNADPRRVFLAPGWLDVWDRTLPYLIEQVPMRVADARKRWPDLDLKQDFSGSDLNNQLGRNDVTNTLSAGPQEKNDDEGMCLVLLCWSQFDGETKQEVVGQREPEGGPYAYCPDCNHKNVADVQGMACPECLRSTGKASELQLALSEEYVADVPVFPNDRALEVVFPLQMKCVRGPWPEGPNGEQLRMPPYMLIRRSEHPAEFCGLSETAVDAPMQTLSNQLMERMRRGVQGPSNVTGVFGEPEDAEGNPWQPTDDPYQLAYFKDPTFDLKAIQLTDISPALFNAIGLVQEQFRADLGTFELSASGAEDVKGVAVGTVEQAAKSGSIPVEHFVRTVKRALGPFWGVISDWLRIGWTRERWVRYQGLLGSMKYELVSGADIPNADFIFADENETSAVNKQEIDALLAWYGTGLPPNGSPAIRRALAAAGKFPISMDLVDQIEQAEAEQAEAMANAMPVGEPPMEADAMGMGDAGQDPNGPEAGTPMGGGLAPDQLMAMMGARGTA